MDNDLASLTRDWLTKALHDLQNATIIRRVEGAPFDTAIYHCQQAAEKAIKGWLTWSGIPVAKTHDLGSLLVDAVSDNPAFGAYLDAATVLTPYATAYRYPGFGEEDMPTTEELDLALQHAEALYDFVLSVLPAEAHPLR